MKGRLETFFSDIYKGTVTCCLRKKSCLSSSKIKATFCLKAWSFYDSKTFHICFCPPKRDLLFVHSLFHSLSPPLFLSPSPLCSLLHTHTYSYANVWSWEINPHIKLKINLERGSLLSPPHDPPICLTEVPTG